MNYAVFGKTMENVRKYRNIKLATTERRRNFSIRTKLSHYKDFNRKFISNRNEKKTETLLNKPVYLGLSILELSKILMYEFWYDYEKPNYSENAKHRQLNCLCKSR